MDRFGSAGLRDVNFLKPKSWHLNQLMPSNRGFTITKVLHKLAAEAFNWLGLSAFFQLNNEQATPLYILALVNAVDDIRSSAGT